MIEGQVSTIIPVYNRPKMLREAVCSVLEQSYQSIEVIVVNDGSTDETAEVAKELQARHEEVRCINIKNSGPALAREAGRQVAKGEFIQYLDSDDLLAPDKFKHQVDSLLSRPECGVTYCSQEYCDMSGKVLDTHWMRSGERHKTMFPAMLAGRLWGTPVPLYRKSVLDKCGPWLNLKNMEDWEYDCRIASMGVKLSYVNKTLVTIRTHSDNHFGDFANDESKMRDRVSAHLAIYQHALNAKIGTDCSEFRHFLRALFLLCRQCGANGLVDESRKLYDIIYESKGGSKKQRIKHKLYLAVATIFGWRLASKASSAFDWLRQ